jgi:hypothetical protein
MSRRVVSEPRSEIVELQVRVATTRGDWVEFSKVCLDRGVTIKDALGRLARAAAGTPYLVEKP